MAAKPICSCCAPAVQRVLEPGVRVAFRCKRHRLSKAEAKRRGVLTFELTLPEQRGETIGALR